MFANVLAAALRNLARNRLYAAISIGGLAIGMAAALLTALFVRDELTFDRFIPGHERIFVLFTHIHIPGRALEDFDGSNWTIAAWLKQDFPQVVRVARYAADNPGVRHGQVEVNDAVAWVDPDFFSIIRLPVLAGDPEAAVQRPDSVVITRAMARKYFGKDAPLGDTLEFARKTPMRVAAVIADQPDNANIQSGIFASALAPTSPMTIQGRQPYHQGNYSGNFRTYVQVRNARDGAVIDAAMPAFIARHMAPPAIMADSPMFQHLTLNMTPLTRMHMTPDVVAEIHTGSMTVVYALVFIAGLILLVAAINFVNLQTALGARRSVEVGVRKAAGAARRHLVAQFLSEAVIYAVMAMVFALALAELTLPGLDVLVRRTIPFEYWRDPRLIGLALGLALMTGSAAGVYPALVLSAFRPAVALKDALFHAPGSAAIRRGLVIVQFAVLIALLLSVMAIYAQTRFALNQAIGLDKEQMLRIQVPGCRGAFVDRVRLLPGIAKSACSSGLAVGVGDSNTSARLPDGRVLFLGTAPVGFDFFEAYNVTPLAGRLPSRAHGGDEIAYDAPKDACGPRSAVVNLATVRAFGLRRPEQMVGISIPVICADNSYQPVLVVGVVPDIAYNLTTGAVKPILYQVDQRYMAVLNVKIRPGQVAATLAAVDQTWKQLGPPFPPRRRFVDQYLNIVYADLISQGWLLSALAGIAAFIAGLGLFGLAAFTTEQRTKEIGVRKTMGASTPDLLRLLLWSFVQPVLWANLLAWPLGWWAMDQWLHGFSARIALSPWFFVASGGAALTIAAATVSAHALRVARAKPVGALRYE
jgi:putative ABC transport system permease protein